MALISELLANIVLLVTRPFSLLKLACLFGIRTAILVIYAWMELVKTIITFNVNIVLGIISWTFGLFSLPLRVLDAFERERQLKQKLQQMQNELEYLVWDHKVLHEHFQMAVKERKMLEVLVAELEEEHDMSIAKIKKLEGKLQEQTHENRRLKEIQGKGYWSSKDQNKTDIRQNIDDSSNSIPHSVLQGKISLQDLLTRKDIWEDESKTRTELLKLLKTGGKPGAVSQAKPETISRDVGVTQVLDHRRDVALSQSLFSAVLSVVVGAIVWQAQDTCMPLVVALFAVVGMSLKSVVQFFSTIKNKPASDAVALLSFNWFIVGTLTYPTLPIVARMLAPILLRLADQIISRFGLHSLA